MPPLARPLTSFSKLQASSPVRCLHCDELPVMLQAWHLTKVLAARLNIILGAKHGSSYHNGMNRLPLAKRVQILSLLCEGSSMRSVSRLVDVSINTVTRELVLAGQACADFHDRTVRNVQSKRVGRPTKSGRLWR